MDGLIEEIFTPFHSGHHPQYFKIPIDPGDLKVCGVV